jgi:cytochrome oxidase assembly protein ShyY1
MSTDAKALRAELTERDKAVIGIGFAAMLALNGWQLSKTADNGERLARIEGRLEHEDRRAQAPAPAIIPDPPRGILAPAPLAPVASAAGI